ncbi:Proteasome subunit beta type-3 [Galdieria sulphuraria]|nr:Proteasome subunit beta type-3 [Galdieria sulphuraria]
MAGDNCVAIAADRRFGVQQTTIGTDTTRIFKINDRLMLGLTGLRTDKIKPASFANMVASTLYSRRFSPYFVEPVVAGLTEKGEPYLCAQDLLGAPLFAEDFVVSGTCAESLYGTSETFWKPNLSPAELFEVTSQSLLAAVDRDCLSGWGAIVHMITLNGIETKVLKARMD